MSFSVALTLPGAIPDLDTLKSVISNWLNRNDLDDELPMFIALVEAEANRELRTPEMEGTTLFSDEDEDRPLPGDYLAMRSIYVEGSPDRPLRAVSPTAIRLESDGTSGCPTAYCLVSGGIRLVPPPAAGILLNMDYFRRIEALSTVAPSNWLLEKHPGFYLFGIMFYAESFLDNAVRAAMWRGLFDGIMDAIKRSAKGDRYGAGALVPNTTRQVRGARC